MFARALAADLTLFVSAVLVGTTGAVISGQLLAPLLGDAPAASAALAIGTTLTGAAHARLVHHRSFTALAPQVAAGVPLAYGAMRAIHVLLGG